MFNDFCIVSKIFFVENLNIYLFNIQSKVIGFLFGIKNYTIIQIEYLFLIQQVLNFVVR